MSDKIEGIRERWAEFESLDHQSQVCDAYLYMRRAHNDRAALLAEVERLRADAAALRAALEDIARGDYSDPMCERTPEQRARAALEGKP